MRTGLRTSCGNAPRRWWRSREGSASRRIFIFLDVGRLHKPSRTERDPNGVTEPPPLFFIVPLCPGPLSNPGQDARQ